MKTINFTKNYLDQYKAYKEKWNYEDGCMLEGAYKLYEVTSDPYYKEFVENFVGTRIANGKIKNYKEDEYNIDNIKSGTIFFHLDTEKYRTEIDQLYSQIQNHPRNIHGNFFHKKIYPDQVWLDGAYMCFPFYLLYEAEFNEFKNLDDIIDQFKNIEKYLKDDKTGLYYHGYDASKKERWADPNTGLSENFWLRSIGWLAMSLVDCIDILKENKQNYKDLENILIDLLDSLKPYYDQKSKMWLQLVDKMDENKNYPEVSGTSQIIYTILKADRIGILKDKSLLNMAEKSIHMIEENYISEDEKELKGICLVAGLGNTPYRDGSVEYYLNEKVGSNDPKGVGSYMMAYAEYINYKRRNGNEEN